MKDLRLCLLLFIILSLNAMHIRSQEISSFTLIDAQNDIEIGLLSTIDTVYLSELPTNELSIRANTQGDIGSLVFEIDGIKVATENAIPYALVGNSGNDYNSWIPELETHSFSASIYSSRNGQGNVLDIYSVTVTFLEQKPVDPILPYVSSLVLVNADTDQDIGLITEGLIINLDAIGTRNLNIRAETGLDTESVRFGYQNIANYHIENAPVYAIGGNSGNDYNPWVPDIGTNKVTATAFSENGGNGTSGNPFSISFEVIDEEPDLNLPVLLRLNSGGDAVTVQNVTYDADEFFVGNGKIFTNNNIVDILDTDLDAIYKSERSTITDLQSFGYNIPVTNGEYEIKLHFAEIYFGATGGGSGGIGKRVFTVSIEGEEVLMDFDINAEKDPMTAIVKTFATTVIDGEINIDFSASVNQPKVSAIEILGEGEITTGTPPEDCVWKDLASSSLSKVESQSIKVNDKLYVLAGFVSGLRITAATEIYDPALNSWSEGAPMPTAVTHMGAVGVGDEIWILAGFVGNHPGVATDLVQIYNTVTDSWSEGPPLPNPRGSGAAAYSDGKIHFFGGLKPDRVTDVGEHYILDVNNIAAGWVEAAPMPDPRNHLSAAAVNGKIYAIGGQFGHDRGVQDQAFMDEYDPSMDSWTRKANLPSARSHFEPGTIVHNNKIIIVGGRRGRFFFDDVTEYNPITDSWSELCELPSNLLAPVAKVFGDRLIVANGGEDGTCCPKNSTISIQIEPETINIDLTKVLIYHETNGFRHGSIESGIDMINEFGNDLNWNVDVSQSSDIFNSANLSEYDVVVWLNTSGDDLLTALEQDAFESFIQNGGGFVGIHAATDTYRDGSWQWYNDLVGGIVQASPNHTANNTNATMDVVGIHPIVEHLGETWNKNEEYYYWERNGGYLYDNNINLLEVRSTGNNSYDAPRPITWYKHFDGGRSFYTALGHNDIDYQIDEDFREMIKNAIIWTANKDNLLNDDVIVDPEDIDQSSDSSIIIYPNPANEYLFVVFNTFMTPNGSELKLYSMDGDLVLNKSMTPNVNESMINVGRLNSGYYMLSFNNGQEIVQKMVFIE